MAGIEAEGLQPSPRRRCPQRLAWTLPGILRGVSWSTASLPPSSATAGRADTNGCFWSQRQQTSIPSHPVLSHPIPSRHTAFHPIIFHPIPSRPVPSCPIPRGHGVLRAGPKQVSALGCAICKQKCSVRAALGVSEEEMLSLPQAVILQDLLPEIMQQLQDADSNIGAKAMTVLHNLLRVTDRQKAVPIALQLPKLLLPFFLNVRPMSIGRHGSCGCGACERVLCSSAHPAGLACKFCSSHHNAWLRAGNLLLGASQAVMLGQPLHMQCPTDACCTMALCAQLAYHRSLL